MLTFSNEEIMKTQNGNKSWLYNIVCFQLFQPIPRDILIGPLAVPSGIQVGYFKHVLTLLQLFYAPFLIYFVQEFTFSYNYKEQVYIKDRIFFKFEEIKKFKIIRKVKTFLNFLTWFF